MDSEIMKKDDYVMKIIEDTPLLPELANENYSLVQMEKLPLAEIGALGSAFSHMINPLKVTQTVTSTGGDLYKCVFPNGITGALAEAKDGSGALGTIIQKGEGIVGQARWQKVDGINQVTTTNIPVDPASMFMAAALMNIEKKLDKISETQKAMFSFMKQKEESVLEADAKFLKTEIIDKYKFNFDNTLWINAHYQKVIDIQQTSNQDIEFYQKRLNQHLKKGSLIVTDSSANKKAEEVYEDLRNYQRALYLNSCSKFVGLMMDKNFDEAFLQRTSDELADNSFEFRKLYTKCYTAIDNDAKKSLNKVIRKGAADTIHFMGNTADKIPLIKNTAARRTLENASDGINNYSHKLGDKYLRRLRYNKESVVAPFIDMIDKLNIIYNQPIAIVCDDENLYISAAIANTNNEME